MKVVYRNGQKFIITDALYEAGKKSNMMANPSDLVTSQKDSTKTRIDNDVNDLSKQQNSQTKSKVIPFGITKEKYDSLFLKAKNQVHNGIKEFITQSDKVDWGDCKDNSDRNTYAFYAADGLVSSLATKDVGDMIKFSLKDDKLSNSTDEKEIIEHIKTAMRNYLKLEIQNSNDGYIKTKVTKALNIIKNNQDSAVKAYLQPYGSEIKEIITNSISSVVNAVVGEEMTNPLNPKPTDNQQSLFPSDNPNGVNTKEHIIKIYYYSKIDKNKKEIISFGDQQNAIKQSFGLAQGSFGQSIVSNDMNVVVGQDNIEITFSTAQTIDIKEILQKVIIPSCIKVAKEVGVVFNSQPNILISINVDGIDYDDISVEDSKNDTKRVFQTIHPIVQGNEYEINSIVRKCLEEITQGLTTENDVENYNKGIIKINERLEKVYQNLYKTQIKPETIIKCLRAIEEKVKEHGLSVENEVVVNAIEDNLNPQEPNKANDGEKNPQEPNKANDGEKNPQLTDIQKQCLELYNLKKMLDNLKINDYYAMDNFAESITDESPLMTKFDQLLEIMGLLGKNFKTHEKMLYIEFVYVDVFSNVCNGELAKLLDDMDEKDIKIVKKEILKQKKKNKNESYSLRDNKNLKHFVSIMGRYPRAKDIQEYQHVYELIHKYGRAMKNAEQLIIDGLADYGIFKKEIDIRPIQIKAYDKILKLESVKNTKIKNAIAYTYLTEFRKDIQKDNEKNDKSNEATRRKSKYYDGDRQLREMVEKIVDIQKPQITFDFISKSVLKEMLIFTNINMQDIIGGMKENDEFLEKFSPGPIRYGEEGTGNKVYTAPILSKKYGNKCIGLLRIRKIFARTRDATNKLFNHDFFKTVFNDLKNL